MCVCVGEGEERGRRGQRSLLLSRIETGKQRRERFWMHACSYRSRWQAPPLALTNHLLSTAWRLLLLNVCAQKGVVAEVSNKQKVLNPQRNRCGVSLGKKGDETCRFARNSQGRRDTHPGSHSSRCRGSWPGAHRGSPCLMDGVCFPSDPPFARRFPIVDCDSKKTLLSLPIF